MSETLIVNPAPSEERKGLTKKEIAADHPTWCPGWLEISPVLALYFKPDPRRSARCGTKRSRPGYFFGDRLLEPVPVFSYRRTARISSTAARCPSCERCISLTRPDLHVFVFGGDGDAFSIGGNHFNHTARKNIKLTYCVMDNWVYGLDEETVLRPRRRSVSKSKTDQWGAVDYPINPMKQAISAGATFVARTTHTNPNHVLALMDAAMDHDGFRFIECLSECVEFYGRRVRCQQPAQRRRVQRSAQDAV